MQIIWRNEWPESFGRERIYYNDLRVIAWEYRHSYIFVYMHIHIHKYTNTHISTYIYI